MALFFVTGNRGKLSEVQAILPDVVQLDVDLPEIQDLDARQIIREKLSTARSSMATGLLVEDTSLYCRCLNGLPGPLIKWFLQALGDEGLSDMIRRLGDDRAEARTIIGYADPGANLHFFEGVIAGRIVPPRGDQGFGWDRIFQPDGWQRTFAEMSLTEKNTCSMRRLALEKFRQFYTTSHSA
jgi:inosine triphosphate pyrophosphatase